MSNEYRIIRLQVQRSPMKIGKAPLRSYEPAALVPVDRIEAGPRGVTGVTADGERVLDVHHRDHPRTRDRKGRAGILFMGTGDYAALRARYGEHLLDGIAGETLLLDAPGGLAGHRVPQRVTIRTASGPVELHGVRVAEPCVEFSRFCLQQPVSPIVDDAVQATLVDLDGGARGYRAIAAGPAVIAAGDIVEFGPYGIALNNQAPASPVAQCSPPAVLNGGPPSSGPTSPPREQGVHEQPPVR